jgi:hypothetical protein
MNVEHLHSSIDIDSLATWLGIQSVAGRDALTRKCSNWHSDIASLQSLSYQFASVRAAQEQSPALCKEVADLLTQFAELEPELRKQLEPDSAMERESKGELLFLGSILSPLNLVPYILSIWAIVRVYILPGMSLLMPVLMAILPYILLRFVFHLKIPMDRYIAMMVGLLAGDTSGLMNPDSTPSLGDLIGGCIAQLKQQPIQALVKMGGVGATVVQAVIQPYFTYRHLSTINTLIGKQGSQLTAVLGLYEELSARLTSLGMEMPRCPIPSELTERQHSASAHLDPVPYTIAMRYIGQIEAIWKLAGKRDVCAVNWHNDSGSDNDSGNNSDQPPIFHLTNTFDIRVSSRIPITVNLSGQRHHALLTGPNRGGKSTALRAMSLCALLAHTYGCSIGESAEMTPFTYMFAGLKADDIPGQKSHFEREVEFTTQTLRMDGPTLVFIDELFHTTNPPDALESCRIYCQQLWNKSATVSVISTHLFDLVRTADTTKVQQLCCPAEYSAETGDVNYKYGLEEGICTVSSVHEILRRYGLQSQSQCAQT